jgi:hypothetical protein
LIGQGHQPHFDAIWSAIQTDIVAPKPNLPRFQMRYGLVMMALVLVFFVPLTMGNQNLTLASPPTQPAPLVAHATPSGTEPGTTETAAAVPLMTDQNQVTPEAPQRNTAPSPDVANTP